MEWEIKFSTPWYCICNQTNTKRYYECRQQSENVFKEDKPKSWIAGGIIIFIWIVIFSFVLVKIF